jgi:hypothetical protein
LGDDVLDITNSVTNGLDFTGFTVSGDLGLGTNAINIAVKDATATTGTPSQTVDVSGVSNSTVTVNVANTVTATDLLTVTGTKDTNSTDKVTFTAGDTFSEVTLTNVDQIGHAALTLNASAISGQAIEMVTNADADLVTLTGTDGADTIDLSSLTAADATKLADFTINGSKGGDTITLNETAGHADIIKFVVTANEGANTITNFDTTVDDLNVDGLTADANNVTTVVTAGGVTAGALTNENVYVINDGATALTAAGAESIADYTDLADVAAYLAEGYTSTAAGDEAVFVINDLVGEKSYVYALAETAAGASTIAEADLALVATVTEIDGGALVSGDVI